MSKHTTGTLAKLFCVRRVKTLNRGIHLNFKWRRIIFDENRSIAKFSHYNLFANDRNMLDKDLFIVFDPMLHKIIRKN